MTLKNSPSLTSLRAFSVVGDCLSVTAAAGQLGVTQSAVSRQIRALEDSLDFRLFHRVGNSIALTPEGRAFHQRIFATFGLLEDAVNDATGSFRRQKINLLAPPTLASRWLSRRLSKYPLRFPGVELAVHTGPRPNIHMDCVIRFGSHPAPGTDHVQLFVEQHVAVCSRELFEDREAMRNGCLLHVFDKGVRFPLWEDWQALEPNHPDLPTGASMEFASLELAIQAAKNSVGVAVVDRNMIEYELDAGSLVQISPTMVEGPNGYWLEISTEQQAKARSVRFFRWLNNMAGGTPGMFQQ
ncbi:LysR family transcriptional regulator [Amaricoccus tamworthensis]|uniref:LysR family transcriptional regulator n=1 Tax=Amaricoccus tamworthensis TaxID=57002 RepID=UPI003C7CFE62